MFSDGKNWFPISSTMTASFPATQAIWPTLLRLPGAVDQGDSCLHLRPHSLRSEKAWKRNVLSIFYYCCLDQKLILSYREYKLWTFSWTEKNVLLCFFKYICVLYLLYTDTLDRVKGETKIWPPSIMSIIENISQLPIKNISSLLPQT